MSALQSASDDDADGYYLQLATIAASSVRHMERISEVQPSVSSSLQQHAVVRLLLKKPNISFCLQRACKSEVTIVNPELKAKSAGAG